MTEFRRSLRVDESTDQMIRDIKDYSKNQFNITSPSTSFAVNFAIKVFHQLFVKDNTKSYERQLDQYLGSDNIYAISEELKNQQSLLKAILNRTDINLYTGLTSFQLQFPEYKTNNVSPITSTDEEYKNSSQYKLLSDIQIAMKHDIDKRKTIKSTQQVKNEKD